MARRVLSLEQGRDHTNLKRPKEHRPIDKADRQAGGRLAVELGTLAKGGSNARCRALARDSAQPGKEPIKSVQRGTDLPLRCKALQVEHPQDIFNPDHGDLEIAIEPSFPCKSQRACAFRYDVGLLDPRLDDLDFAVVRLPCLQTLGPRHGRKVIKAMDHAGDVRIDRRRGEGVHLFRGCMLHLQYPLRSPDRQLATRELDAHAAQNAAP